MASTRRITRFRRGTAGARFRRQPHDRQQGHHSSGAEGYRTRQAGLGTFVIQRKAESSLHEVMNVAAEVRARGRAYNNRVLCCEALAADDEVALRLGLRLGTEVFHSILVHLEDGVAIQREDRYGIRAGPHSLQSDFSRQMPNEVLVASCPVSDVEHIVEAVLANAQTARWLEIAAGAACLSMIRRTWSNEHLVR